MTHPADPRAARLAADKANSGAIERARKKVRALKPTKDATITAPLGTKRQPVSAVQWIERSQLHANDYNPNAVPPPELALLKVSILADGWTQPIVARADMTIVDGFHRWSISEDSEVAALTDGLLPVVFLAETLPLAHQMAATIRHNRARGVHAVRPMAAIIRDLVDSRMATRESLMRDMGMEREEVDRLYALGNAPGRQGTDHFNQAWVPELNT